VVVDYEREIPLAGGERKEKRAYASLYVGKGGKKKYVRECMRVCCLVYVCVYTCVLSVCLSVCMWFRSRCV
jgi:hypothetical protein